MQNKQINFPGNFAKLSRKKKILFACVPADGHFKPLTSLAKHLQSEGFDVRWYCSTAYQASIRKLDIPFYPFNKAIEVTGSNVDKVYPERKFISNKTSKLNFDIINFFTLRGPEYFTDIQEIQEEFPFDLVVADCCFAAIPMIKDVMKIPVVSIGVLPLFETSRDLPPSGLGMTPSHNIYGKAKQGFLRFFTNRVLFKDANRVMKKTMKAYGIIPGKKGMFDLLVSKSTLLLQSGTPGFEYYRSDLGKNIRFIGPLLPYRKSASDQWFDMRLNQYQRIVLVTQGTVETDVEKIIVPTLKAFKNTDTLVVATTGGSNTRELKQRFADDNFIIEDFIPFEDVMPYADVYVSNGGYGGVMLAIENKLPMVVAGVHEGKNEINARIGYFNLGIDMKTEQPAVPQLRTAIEEVMQDTKYRQAVMELGDEFDQYEPLRLASKYINEVLHEKPANKVYILPALDKSA